RATPCASSPPAASPSWPPTAPSRPRSPAVECHAPPECLSPRRPLHCPAMSQRKTKIAIVGAGSVGATVAYACMIRGVAPHVVLYDTNRAKVDAELLDLNHGLQFVPMATIEGSDDVGICGDADVVVITAGAKQKPGQSRTDLAHAN